MGDTVSVVGTVVRFVVVGVEVSISVSLSLILDVLMVTPILSVSPVSPVSAALASLAVLAVFSVLFPLTVCWVSNFFVGESDKLLMSCSVEWVVLTDESEDIDGDLVMSLTSKLVVISVFKPLFSLAQLVAVKYADINNL